MAWRTHNVGGGRAAREPRDAAAAAIDLPRRPFVASSPSPSFAHCGGRKGTGNCGVGPNRREGTKHGGSIHRSWPMAGLARGYFFCFVFVFFTSGACLFMRAERCERGRNGAQACWAASSSSELEEEGAVSKRWGLAGCWLTAPAVQSVLAA